MIMSLETFFASRSGNRRWLWMYAVYMLLQSLASIAFGAVVLTGAVDLTCAGAQNVSTCAIVATFAALAFVLGSSSVGLLASAVSLLVWVASREGGDERAGAGNVWRRDDDATRKLAL